MYKDCFESEYYILNSSVDFKNLIKNLIQRLLKQLIMLETTIEREKMTENNAIWQPEILENDLLQITPLVESDFENLFQVASDPLIWEQHPASDRYKIEVFQLFFDGAIAAKKAFKITSKSNHKIIGSTRFYNYHLENSSIAIGYTFLARQYWGGAYNKSSKKLLIDYAFQFVDKIYFHIGATNIRSQQATTSIGAKKVREFESELNGVKTTHFEYQIEKENWKVT